MLPDIRLPTLQSLWLTIPDIDKRLAWLRGLGVPDDRIRFLYAREPVFTASIDSFKPQLDFMFGDVVALTLSSIQHTSSNQSLWCIAFAELFFALQLFSISRYYVAFGQRRHHSCVLGPANLAAVLTSVCGAVVAARRAPLVVLI